MTMSKSKFVGVDGCPYGWFSVGLDNCEGYEVKRSRRSASCWTTTAMPGLFSWTSRLGFRRAGKDVIATARPGSYSVVLVGQVSSQRQLARR